MRPPRPATLVVALALPLALLLAVVEASGAGVGRPRRPSPEETPSAASTNAVGASGATQAEQPQPVDAVTLLQQDAWVPVGGELGLRVQIPDSVATEGATLNLVAHQSVTTRSAFERLLTSNEPGSVLDQVVIPMAALPAGPAGEREVVVGIESSAAARDQNRLSLRRTGVYPLQVEVLDAQDQSRGGFLTMAVAVAVDLAGVALGVDAPLGVAWTWPLTSGPSTLPDGAPDPQVTNALRPDGRLGRQAVALTRAGDVPLTLVPGPETLEAWQQQGENDPAIARGAAAVRDAVGRDQFVSATYVPTNLPSLLAAELDSTVDAELVHGDETLALLLGTRPDVRTALARPVDAASLARLQARGVDRLIVDGDALESPAGTPAPVRPFLLQPAASLIPSGPVNAVAADPAIERVLTADVAPALRAQRALATLSIVALEAPDARRAITIVNPADLDAPLPLLDGLLTGLRGNPLLDPMTIDQVFNEIPAETSANGAPITRELAGYTPPRPPVPVVPHTNARTRLDSFRGLAGPTDPVVLSGERALLLCESATFDGPVGTARARATLASIHVGIKEFVGQISVPRPSTITLTSRSGEIPLTFRNSTGRAIDVLLELASTKLTFPEGATVAVRLQPRSTTIRVPVEARTSGTFPLQLQVTSSDGTLPVANSTFRVRSTAFSFVGIALMVGAAVFLVVWWGLHIRRNRRARRSA